MYAFTSFIVGSVLLLFFSQSCSGIALQNDALPPGRLQKQSHNTPSWHMRCEVPSTAKKLFYNRIPKSASSSMNYLCQALSKEHGWHIVHSKVFDDRGFFSEEEERSNVRRIANHFREESYVMYDQHIRYLNFTKFGEEQPLYFNMMRNPINRIVSSYYFARTGKHHANEIIREQLGDAADWSVDECIVNRENCPWAQHSYSAFNIMTKFFCGHDSSCEPVGEAALMKAKENMMKYFVVVGLSERFTDTARLLEKRLPLFFGGSMEILGAQEGQGARNINSKAGPPPNPSSVAYLREKSKFDVELYEFAEAQLNEQLRMCDLV